MQNKYRILLENVKKAESEDKNYENPEMTPQELYSDRLELYLKKYDYPGALSKHLHEYDTKSNNVKDLFINGPMGVGLDVETNLKGVYICLAGGTGAYCFLDMVTYVLRYIVDILNKKLNLTDNYIDKEETFSEIDENFTLVYMSSFSDKANGVYTDICQELDELDKKYDLNKFKFINRFSDDKPKPPRWNADVFKKELGGFKGRIQKAFICGPTPFLDDTKVNLLKSELFTKEQITMV